MTILNLLIAYILLLAGWYMGWFAGWFAGRCWEREIRCSRERMDIMHQITKSRKARTQTEIEKLRSHLPAIRVEELKDA